MRNCLAAWRIRKTCSNRLSNERSPCFIPPVKPRFSLFSFAGKRQHRRDINVQHTAEPVGQGLPVHQQRRCPVTNEMGLKQQQFPSQHRIPNAMKQRSKGLPSAQWESAAETLRHVPIVFWVMTQTLKAQNRLQKQRQQQTIRILEPPNWHNPWKDMTRKFLHNWSIPDWQSRPQGPIFQNMACSSLRDVMLKKIRKPCYSRLRRNVLYFFQDIKSTFFIDYLGDSRICLKMC